MTGAWRCSAGLSLRSGKVPAFDPVQLKFAEIPNPLNPPGRNPRCWM